MAFDGITCAAIVREMKTALTGGGISRIAQTEKDELLLTIKSRKQTFRVLMSASASLPLLALTEDNRPAPLTAPAFCMLLRKHLQGGQILDISQPSLERVVIFKVGHRDELGDMTERKLIIELMGKYSNIILTDESDTILDSIKRIPSSVSSVREVLPGRPYFIPVSGERTDPLTCDYLSFGAALADKHTDIVKTLYTSFTGLSPVMAESLVFDAGIEGRMIAAELSEEDKSALFRVFRASMDAVAAGLFAPAIYYEGGVPREYAALPMAMYGSFEKKDFDSISALIHAYYGEKEAVTRMRQKSADLRRITQTALDRTNKKLVLQEKQMADTEKRDLYRIRGELLHTYGYGAEEGADSITVTNYYTNEPMKIPLDPTLTAAQNAQRYYDRYSKLKRTAEALSVQIEETKSDREQLSAILLSIDLAESEADLADIRRELTDYGFLSRKGTDPKGKSQRGREAKSRPMLYISSDGFKMYVGRNNLQNEEVTFGIGGGNDWWFHAKGQPGSHVIVKMEGRTAPDRLFEEAGALAAYYSKGRQAPKVEIDYTLRKNLRKTTGGKPGFVIYHTNYSLMATPDISGLKRE